MRRPLVVGILLLATACAGSGGVTIIPPDELPRELYGEQEQVSAEERDVRVTVYFVEQLVDDPQDPTDVRLLAFLRSGTTELRPEEFAMSALLRALREEGEPEFATAIPPGTELLRFAVEDGVAHVNLTAEFERPDAALFHQLRVAQVVWTLTELPHIDAVRFLVHGQPEPVIDTDGVAHEVVGRGRYAAFAPVATEARVDDCPLSDRIEGTCPEEEAGSG